jgi:hypothetical protein
MTKWTLCKLQGGGEIYLDLTAAIAMRPLEGGGTRVYFAAAEGDGKLGFTVADDTESLASHP